MPRRCAFWIDRGCSPTIGLAWLLGMFILLGWASPLKGQSANQPSNGSPAQQPQNGFWPLGPDELPPPPSTAAPGNPNNAPTNSEGGVPSANQQKNPPSEKSSEQATSQGTPSSASLPNASASPASPPPVAADKPQVAPSAAGRTSAGEGRGLPTRPNRIREGARISQQKGVFTITGDRVVFAASDGTLPKLVVLENLNLQRVIQTIQGSSQQELWVVAGRVTEFQGVNYLLLDRAIRIDEADLEQTPAAPPAEIVLPTPPAMPSAAQPPLEPTSAAGAPPR